MLCTTTNFEPIGRLYVPWNAHQPSSHIEFFETELIEPSVLVPGATEYTTKVKETCWRYPVTFHKIRRLVERDHPIFQNLTESLSRANGAAHMLFSERFRAFKMDELTNVEVYHSPQKDGYEVVMRTPVVACTAEQSEEIFDLAVFTPF